MTCENCRRAQNHAWTHGHTDITYVHCRPHAALDHLINRFEADNNPNTSRAEVVERWRVPEAFEGREIVHVAEMSVRVQIRDDDVWRLTPVKTAVVDDGEYVDREWAVYALLETPLGTTGTLQAALLSGQEGFDVVCRAIVLGGDGRRVNTASWGKAVASEPDDDVVAYEQRTTCEVCERPAFVPRGYRRSRRSRV